MVTELYIEAPLVDEDLADQVWEAWDRGEIDDQVAALAWTLLIVSSTNRLLAKVPVSTIIILIEVSISSTPGNPFVMRSL